MSAFELHSFCHACGGHRRRMPFGDYNTFWDRAPCPSCGSDDRYGIPLVARRAQIGRWPWQRGWIDRDGNVVDVRSDT